MFLRNLKMSQKLIFGFGIITLVMLAVLGYTYINYSKEAKGVDINLFTYEVIREVDGIMESLVNMETGARGYAITGKEEFLQPYNEGKADYEQHYNTARKLMSEHPAQQERLLSLQKNYQAWLEWETGKVIMGRQKVLAGQMKMEDLIAVVQTAEGKKEMDNIRELVDEIVREEQRLLDIRNQSLRRLEAQTVYAMVSGGFVVIIIAILLTAWIVQIVVNPVKTVTNTFMEISQGDVDLKARLKENSKDELGDMARHFNAFMCKLRVIIQENQNQSWLKTGQAELSDAMRGEPGIETLAANIINYVSKYVNAQIGAIYVKTLNNTFRLAAGYAYKHAENVSGEVKPGEGLVGQSVLERKIVAVGDVPDNYIKISSGLGEAAPKNIVVVPCVNNNEAQCVLELGTFKHLTDIQMEFLEQVAESIAVSLDAAVSRNKMRELLEKTLQQSEELQVQQEELRQSNEELEEQTKALKISEARLQTQQEELRQSNEELEEQTRALRESEARLQAQQEELRIINEELEERTKSLEQQKNDINSKNRNLERAQAEIEEKANALEIASKYKSEFLANMSHELRTPLNSIIVLSQMLAAKKDHTPLTDKQLEFAATIHSSGQDLLKLINDVLDLSKVEAGKLDVNMEEINLAEFAQYVERSFRPIALQKGLELKVHIDERMPEDIVSDMIRVQQIVNNLLSNAFKFTPKGGVTMVIRRPNKNEILDFAGDSDKVISIAVTDTGIGIPEEKQQVIFEAFKQSDGTTSRKYGGTGLGLSISKELAHLLGGKIDLDSREGLGSTFTLVLPEYLSSQKALAEVAATEEEVIVSASEENVDDPKLYKKLGNHIPDDRENIDVGDKTILIIEDDLNFSSILSDLAHEKGYKCIAAADGETGMEMAVLYKPDAILLDIGLPDINGWKVIDRLKRERQTEHIPVHVISGADGKGRKEVTDGTVGYLQKPVNLESLETVFHKIEGMIAQPLRKLLVVDSDRDQVLKITELLGKKGIHINTRYSGAAALELMKTESFDCLVLDLKLEDMSGIELLAKLREENKVNIPVIIHTEKVLTQDDEAQLQKYVESIIIKGSRSMERLVAEASLFLHDVDSRIEEKKIKAIRSDQEKEESLKNKKILIVDDDMRNVFALSSVLEEKGIKVVVGRNGKEGIQKLQQNADIDLVIMDIMMPEMDGYTAMKEIRNDGKYRRVPIIALTAKAMKDDRQKCIEAGASDYLTKPIDVDKLITLLRVWLYK